MIDNYVLIIGSMKSGTTSLFDLLARHPAIAPSRIKEAGFFAFEERWALGFDWYDALFDFEPGRHRYALEGSTDYTKQPFCTGVVERLEASAPRDFRLIYIMRDPLKRIESHARHTQRTGKEVGQCRSPRDDHGLDAGISPVSLAISRYAYQLGFYEAFRRRGQLHLVVLEEFLADQQRVIDGVLDFLDLPRDPALYAPVASNRAEERRAHTSLSAKLRYSRKLGWLPDGLRQRAVRLFGRKVNLAGRFRLNDAERAALLEELGPDLRALEEDYGIAVDRNWRVG